MIPQADWQGFQHALPAFPFGLIRLAHGRDYTGRKEEVGCLCRFASITNTPGSKPGVFVIVCLSKHFFKDPDVIQMKLLFSAILETQIKHRRDLPPSLRLGAYQVVIAPDLDL